MISYKIDTSYERGFKQANKFMVLVESYDISKSDDFDLNVIYVNMLLASELFLKCILLKNGKSAKSLKKAGHNLYALYNKLPNDNKIDIKNRFSWFHNINIISVLDIIKNDFVTCRYMFIEGNEKKAIYFNAVKEFMYEVQHMASKYLYGKDTYKELR